MQYLSGFLTSTALLLLEHITLYAPLRPVAGDSDSRNDAKVLVKFLLGVGAVLAGCAVVKAIAPTADPLLTPLACSASGLAIIIAYLIRAAVFAAWTRGWLTGLADKGDLTDEPARERGHLHD